MYLSCGIYESLIYENRSLVPLLQGCGIEVRYEEARGAGADRSPRLRKDERLESRDRIRSDDRVDRVAGERDVGIEDVRRSTRDDAVNADVVGALSVSQAAGALLVIDAAELLPVVDRHIDCGRIGRAVQNLQLEGSDDGYVAAVVVAVRTRRQGERAKSNKC